MRPRQFRFVCLITVSLFVATICSARANYFSSTSLPLSSNVEKTPVDSGTRSSNVPINVPAISLSGFKNTGSLSSNSIIDITVGIPLRNAALLDSMVQQVSDPRSTTYKHFITQEQARQMFYPTSQFSSLVQTLTTDGFHIQFTGLDSMIVAEGTVAQVKQYLGLSVDAYSNGTSMYYAAAGTPILKGAYFYASNVTAVIYAHPTDLITRQGTIKVTTGGDRKVDQSAAYEAFAATDLRAVYNATGLLSQGYDGTGKTIGILDFAGDPYIYDQLQYFDSGFGIPNPPSFKISPIGPYVPIVGVIDGWAEEISLDVEVSHAMAPGANMILYIANYNLPFAPVIAYIVQQGLVNDLSMSFGEPESLNQGIDATSLAMNTLFTDEYFALGSVTGITFISSTGDVGGSGYSGGPEGTIGYPSTSPYVTAVGATATYITYASDGSVQSFNQTAWSNYGFIPNEINYGGSTGGISIQEPKPWYQNVTIPKGYPNGRANPDLSLDGSGDPGVLVVMPGYELVETGGTSESSPLLAGLLTLIMQYTGNSIGLLNPTLYALGPNSPMNKKVFTSITFGYNIPWQASSGYNLVTGLGVPNIGELAVLNVPVASQLDIDVHTSNSTVTVTNSSYHENASFQEFVANQTINITASINSTGNIRVTSGNFEAELETVDGVVKTTTMGYNNILKMWNGSIIVPADAQGISFIQVNGSSSEGSGYGFAEIFTGYVMAFPDLVATAPYSVKIGIPINASITYLNDTLVKTGSFAVQLKCYSILQNNYSSSKPINLTYDGLTKSWNGMILGNYSVGPAIIEGINASGDLVFINGVSFQNFFILPELEVEPGSTAPGQYINIKGKLISPVNLPGIIDSATYDWLNNTVEYASNITAFLVDPSGNIVETMNILQDPLSPYEYDEWMPIPFDATPGLYTILLNSSYYSVDLGYNLTGSYYGQINVAPSESIPNIIVSPVPMYEGQAVTIIADITYANGKEVQSGMYTASVYSNDLEGDLASITTQDAGIPLYYNSSIGEWIGAFILPSPEDPSPNYFGSVEVGPQGYSGPYCVFVSGISADGVPTTSDPSYQYSFFVQPELYVSPAISIFAPTSGYSFTTSVPIDVQITGNDVVYVGFYVNSQLVKSFSTGGSLSYTLDTSNYTDGTYILTIIALQSDGMYNEVQTTFVINRQVENIGNELNVTTVLTYIAVGAIVAIAVAWILVYSFKKHASSPKEFASPGYSSRTNSP